MFFVLVVFFCAFCFVAVCLFLVFFVLVVFFCAFCFVAVWLFLVFLGEVFFFLRFDDCWGSFFPLRFDEFDLLSSRALFLEALACFGASLAISSGVAGVCVEYQKSGPKPKSSPSG